MGSHAGCGGGSCHAESSVNILRFMGFHRLAKTFPLKFAMDLTFPVGVSQIELAEHGSQDYKFFPEIRQIEHNFRNVIASTHRALLYSAEARLNPAIGISKTSFEAVSVDQKAFFPSIWRLSLFLQFDFEMPLLNFFKRSVIRLFNKEPLTYETRFPLTGFPPINEPEFVLLKSVDLFDSDNPNGPPALTIKKKSPILQTNNILYNIEIKDFKSYQNGSFEFLAKIGLIRSIGNTQTILALLPTRGVVMQTPLIQKTVVGNVPSFFKIKGQVVDPDEEHLEVTLRPYSADPRRIGFGRLDVHLPGAKTEKRLTIESPGIRKIRSGDSVQLNARAKFSSDVSEPEFIWIAPHGVDIEDDKSRSPRFIAPKVDELTETWFTLYIRDKKETSRPFKFEFLIEP